MPEMALTGRMKQRTWRAGTILTATGGNNMKSCRIQQRFVAKPKRDGFRVPSIKTSFFCLALIVPLFAVLEVDAQSVSPPNLKVKHWKSGDAFGKLREGVDLRFQTIEGNAEKRGVYVYRKNGERTWRIISLPIENVNAFLATAVDPVDENDFLQKQMLRLLRAIMANPNSSIIDDTFVARYRKFGITETAEKLQPLISKTSPVFKGNTWVIDVNVASASGGVENWEVVGMLAPLRICAIKRVLLHPPGWKPSEIYSGDSG